MAGIAGALRRIFGGPALSDAYAINEPHPGVGGYKEAGPGRSGEAGYPGSTSQNRTFKGRSPRSIGIGADTDTGTDTNTLIRFRMQNNHPTEFYGGPALVTGPGNRTAGMHPLSPSQAEGGHSARDTTTPWRNARPDIAPPPPGAQNVRNTLAQKYKAVPGDVHTYKSAARPDQAVNKGQNTDGNVHPDAVTQDVSVPNRAVFPQQTWSVLREMPYAGRGDGARGSSRLDGSRYYASDTGPGNDMFLNAGQGGYGNKRLAGAGGRPVSFTQPAPWTANVYDTTASAQSQAPGQQPAAIYVAPQVPRPGNAPRRG